eukprot:TRINITY_DN10779_c0_g1_i1.p1 TRINITY_DN10779_c0_g1~~TRINITY_DN10779_c0_g1_i1.p1  ORF type:complete len:404 (+),score=84.38 TRINITY_DN10779_c0_g1_i1:628-1839(+)
MKGETEDERILRLGREAAAVPASSMQGGDVCKEVEAEKRIVELENKLIQSELKLREAHKELARLYSRDDRTMKSSVATQTPPVSGLGALVAPTQPALSPHKKSHREGSRLLTNSDFKTFKRFVKRVYSRFNPKADPDEFIKKWAGRESEGVLFIQHNFNLSSAMIAEMCKDPKDIPVKKPVRRASPSPVGVRKEMSVSKTMDKPKKKAEHPSTPTPAPAPAPKHQRVKLTQNTVVVITDPHTYEVHRGTYLGRDERGLCCVQIFGSSDVSRYHPCAVKPETHSMTAEKKPSKKRQDTYNINLAPPSPIVGDEVMATPDGEEKPRNAVIAAKDARDGRCLVVFRTEKRQPKTPPRGRRAPAEEPEPEEPVPPLEKWVSQEELTVIRYSTSSRGPSAVHTGAFEF